MTVLIHRAAYDPRPAARRATWLLLALAGGLMCLSFPVFPIYLQAIGNNLAATAVLIAGLVWYIKNPPASNSDITSMRTKLSSWPGLSRHPRLA